MSRLPANEYPTTLTVSCRCVGLSGPEGVNAEQAFKEQRRRITLKTCKGYRKKIAASEPVALRVLDLLQAVSISYKCLSYKKEVWLKHMQENE